MKKHIKYLFSIMLSAFVFCFTILMLLGCNKTNTKNLTGTMSITSTGSTMSFTCTVTDPDGVATAGSVMVHYWEYDTETGDKTGGSTLKFSNLPAVDSTGNPTSETKIASGLKAEQTYYIKFYCTVGDSEFVFEEKEAQTNSQGKTSDNAIEISNADELYNMKEDLDAYYKLIQDINLSTYTGSSKGEALFNSSTYKFAGHLDGNGHTIFNYSQTTSNQYGSLIGYVAEDGIIENLTVDSSTLNYSRSSTGYSGAFVAYNEGTIKNCTVKNASVTYKATSTSNSVDTNIGGFVGSNLGTIESCTVEGSVTSEYKLKENVGGFAGSNLGKITNCTSDVTVSVSSTSSSTSTVYLTYNVGGFTGFNEGRIVGSIAKGSVTAKYSYDSNDKELNKTLAHNLGGFVGFYNQGVINSCLADVDIAYESSQSFVANIGAFFGYVATSLNANMAQNNVVYATNHTFDVNVLSSDGKFNFEYEEYVEGSTTETVKKTSERKININWLNSLDTTYVDAYYTQNSFALIGGYTITCDESSVQKEIKTGVDYTTLTLEENVLNYIQSK